MKRNLQLIAVLCACSMLLLTGCQSSKTFSPSADATWGQLCKQFQPEWYDSLSPEIQTEYDKIALGTIPDKEIPEGIETIQSSTAVSQKEDDKLNQYTACERDRGMVYESDTEFPKGRVSLELYTGEEPEALNYAVSINGSQPDAISEIAVSVALYDKEAEEYLAVCTETMSGEKDGEIEDSFSDLKSGHRYSVQVIAVVSPMEGYQSSGPLYVEKEVTTKESTTK